jgi:hypothetical protein
MYAGLLNKNWLIRNPDDVPEWSDISTCRLVSVPELKSTIYRTCGERTNHDTTNAVIYHTKL